MGNACCSEGG
jgi:hypothetical protein